MKIFAQRLKDLREERGLTRKQVAEAFRVSVVSYCRFEAGLLKRSLVMAVKAAVFFDVSIDSLVGRVDDRNPRNRKKAFADLFSNK